MHLQVSSYMLIQTVSLKPTIKVGLEIAGRVPHIYCVIAHCTIMPVIIFIATFPQETGNATFQLKAKQLIHFFGVDTTKPAHSGLRGLRALTQNHLFT